MKTSPADFVRTIKRAVKRAASSDLSFEMLFAEFREIMESHNKAIEIIADMGEKLGGDYLFDINYVKSAYAELYSAVSLSVDHFDLLTRNKYSHLRDVLARIDNLIRLMISDSVREQSERVVFCEDVTWEGYRDIGGKNAGLAELRNSLNIRIPEAFFITVQAFDDFLRFNGIDGKIDSLYASEPPGDYLTAVTDAIRSAEIPPDMKTDMDHALKKIIARCGKSCLLAIRSSAEREDGEFSFAGQFDTFLGIAADRQAVGEAYKGVAASLFSPRAFAYRKSLGLEKERMRMAVGCMAMVDAVASGVAYSSDPQGKGDTVLINAVWGLGTSVVEGQTDSDLYVIKKTSAFDIMEQRCGRKDTTIKSLPGGGIEATATPERLEGKMSLKPDQAKELASVALRIEKHFGVPQDIEWAIDDGGKLFILQSRKLRGWDAGADMGVQPPVSVPEERTVLMANEGVVVQKGAGAGKVFVVKKPNSFEGFTKGSVLVSKHDSSRFVLLMPHVSAIITETGSPTSHMASLCREFRIPTIVNAGKATDILRDGMKITVSAGEEGSAVYNGIDVELVKRSLTDGPDMTSIHEYRKGRYVLRYISPLRLIGPLLADFSPEDCRTVHDILRFIHEKSVSEIVDRATRGTLNTKGYAAVSLDLPVMAGITVIDIGGALEENTGGSTSTRKKDARKKSVTFEEITSAPLRAVIKGMLFPGAWHSQTVPLSMKDLFTSMTRMPDVRLEGMASAVRNLAVASRDYLNLSLKFGYHYTVLDCYCTDNARNNHIYFRFGGGATDITQRSRRVRFLEIVLKELGLLVGTKGDILVARIARIDRKEMEGILDQLGRLMAFSRKLDALFRDDKMVERFAKNFLNEIYELTP